jgi:membrane-associated protease RseP (regulator of RpoE activity)
MLFHEFGHYIASRKHNVDVTLPFFIPAPFPSLIGTLGAVIRSKSAFINRRQLLDIGAAGPLAGLVVAFVVLIIGIGSSSYIPIADAGPNTIAMGESLLYNGLEYLIKGPAPENQALLLNSVAVAGWAGLLITMINLMPIGQLDGGHITYALFGRRQKYLAWASIAGLAVLSFYWIGWGVWLVISIFIKPYHPPTIMDEIELGTGRKIIGYLCILAFILCFMPVPLSLPN